MNKMSPDPKLSNLISKQLPGWASETSILPSHSQLKHPRLHFAENIIHTAHSTQDTPQPGLCLPLQSHFSLSQWPARHPSTGMSKVPCRFMLLGLWSTFSSGPDCPFSPLLLLLLLFTQFLRWSSSQEAMLTPLVPQTLIFSSINCICIHYR